jgi:hypothetical protein
LNGSFPSQYHQLSACPVAPMNDPSWLVSVSSLTGLPSYTSVCSAISSASSTSMPGAHALVNRASFAATTRDASIVEQIDHYVAGLLSIRDALHPLEALRHEDMAGPDRD